MPGRSNLPGIFQKPDFLSAITRSLRYQKSGFFMLNLFRLAVAAHEGVDTLQRLLDLLV